MMAGSANRVTNREVAELLGISESMASLLRSGGRNPSIRLMTRIHSVYRWKMSSQAKLFGTPAYAAKFEEAINRHHDREATR